MFKNCTFVGNYGDSSIFFPPLWKYATLADSYIEESHFRELGQLLIDREIAAISDWKENSAAPFLIMRDHKDKVIQREFRSLFAKR